jgi:hypothetical protein
VAHDNDNNNSKLKKQIDIEVKGDEAENPDTEIENTRPRSRIL